MYFNRGVHISINFKIISFFLLGMPGPIKCFISHSPPLCELSELVCLLKNKKKKNPSDLISLWQTF